MLEHRAKKHGWKPVGGSRRNRDQSRARRANQSQNVFLSRFAVLLLSAAICLPLTDSPSTSWAEPTSPTRLEPVPAAITQPKFARDVAQPSITLRVTPENPRAGTRVWITVETVGIEPDQGLNWRFPQIEGIEGDTFEAAAIVDDSGRGCQIVWPEGGEYPIAVETLQIEGRTIPGGEGKPDRFVPTKWQIVTGRVNLVLRGGAAPVTPIDVPKLPAPSAEMQGKVAGLAAAVAQATPEQQAVMANVWYDFAATVATVPVIPKTTGAFKAALTHYTNAAGAATGLAGAFPGFSAALEAAFVATFGDEDTSLDKAKAIEFSQAVAWACGAK